jgi:hypothetical protein
MLVPAISHHPPGDVTTQEYEINTSNLHIQFEKQRIVAISVKMWMLLIV